MIREATLDDLPKLIGLAERHYAQDPFAVEFDEQGMWAWMSHAIHAPQMVVLMSEGGVFMGVVAPMPFDLVRVVAEELWWYAEDHQGQALVEAFTAWAKRQGATEVQITFTHNMRHQALKRKLSGLGFQPSENSFMKQVA